MEHDRTEMTATKNKHSKKAAVKKEREDAQIALVNGTITYDEFLTKLSPIELRQHQRLESKLALLIEDD